MLKNILNLKGAQLLSKNEQKTVLGGCVQGYGDGVCQIGHCIVRWPCDKPCPNGTDPICNTNGNP